MTLADLRRTLASIPAGAPKDDARLEIELLLSAAWSELVGSDQHCTMDWKLQGRAEDLWWDPPNLAFRLERHGATVLGSKNAEVHHWIVDVDAGTANCIDITKRLVRSNASRLDVEALAAEIVAAMNAHAEDSLTSAVRIGPDLSNRHLSGATGSAWARSKRYPTRMPPA